MDAQTAENVVRPDLERHMREMRSRVFDHMLRTRGHKYRSFLRYLRFFKYAACAPDRGEFLESYYTLMRYLDDIVDGDAAIPNGYNSGLEYIAAKIKFAGNPVAPADDVDYLMLYCFEIASRFDAEFSAETNDILQSLMFDAKRKGKWIIFSQSELQHHFYLLDIRGTIRATLKVFNDDADKFTLLQPLGIACRHQYDIEDIVADLAVGYINISLEDCDRFNITVDELQGGLSTGIKQWLKYHAEKGLELLDEHHRIIPKGNFSLLEKAVFKLVYEKPAKETFLKCLSA